MQRLFHRNLSVYSLPSRNATPRVDLSAFDIHASASFPPDGGANTAEVQVHNLNKNDAINLTKSAPFIGIYFSYGNAPKTEIYKGRIVNAEVEFNGADYSLNFSLADTLDGINFYDHKPHIYKRGTKVRAFLQDLVEFFELGGISNDADTNLFANTALKKSLILSGTFSQCINTIEDRFKPTKLIVDRGLLMVKIQSTLQTFTFVNGQNQLTTPKGQGDYLSIKALPIAGLRRGARAYLRDTGEVFNILGLNYTLSNFEAENYVDIVIGSV